MIDIRSKEQFQQLLSQHQVIVVDIYADWCHPCKVMAPEFAKLAHMYSQQNPNVVFCKSDAENKVFQVKGLPTIEFYVNGQSYHTILGADLEDLRKSLRNLFPATQIEEKSQATNVGFKKKAGGSQYKTYGQYT